MDINCTYDCAHQKDGKCELTEIPPSINSALHFAVNNGEDCDCAYFELKQRTRRAILRTDRPEGLQ